MLFFQMKTGEKAPQLNSHIVSNAYRNKRKRKIHRWPIISVLVLVSLLTLYHSPRMLVHPLINLLLSFPLILPHDQIKTKTFQIKHIFHHNTGGDFTHGRLDISPEFIQRNNLQIAQQTESWTRDVSPWNIKLHSKTNNINLKRLSDRSPDFIESYLDYARTKGSEMAQKIHLDWDDELVESPNITDKETVIALALMSSNAYVELPNTGDWRDVKFNQSFSHGWNDTGVRGHVFVSDDESTVVISYKGTSAAYISGTASDDTVARDKINDNLLFSCCCARVSYMWTTVCDCYKSSYTCDQQCLEKELYKKDHYYQSAINVYRNVTSMYPNANIWVTGHSLGGALASLIGRTFGVPAVSFEAPGELLATKRLHLPMPPGLPGYMEGVWHFGHTADPIFMGVCNGATSSCSIAGYAMETQCHTGKQCIYDVVNDLGWHVNMMNHRIHTVIDDVIEAYNDTARCIEVPPCRDCFDWSFVADTPRKPVPTSSSTTPLLPTTSDPVKEPECKQRTWYGRCIEFEDSDSNEDSPKVTKSDKTPTNIDTQPLDPGCEKSNSLVDIWWLICISLYHTIG